MAISEWLGRLKMPAMPRAKDVAEAPQHIKETMQQSAVNSIKVKWISHDGRFVQDTTAIIRRDTKFPIALGNVPEPFGIILRPGGTLFNKTTSKDEIYAIEGYCASLVLVDELKEIQQNDYAAGLIGKDGYLMPVSVNDIPRLITRIKVDTDIPGIIKEVEIVPATLHEMATKQWMKGMTQNEMKGAAVFALLFSLIGSVITFLILSFARGGS